MKLQEGGVCLKTWKKRNHSCPNTTQLVVKHIASYVSASWCTSYQSRLYNYLCWSGDHLERYGLTLRCHNASFEPFLLKIGNNQLSACTPKKRLRWNQTLRANVTLCRHKRDYCSYGMFTPKAFPASQKYKIGSGCDCPWRTWSKKSKRSHAFTLVENDTRCLRFLTP